MKGFHTYGPSKEESYFLHEKGPNEYYGVKSFEELKEWTLKDMPKELIEILKKVGKETSYL